LAQIISILQCIKILKKISPTPTTLRGDDVICDVIKKAVYRQRRTFNKSFQKEKHDTASQLLKKYANRNYWSCRWL